jgi:ABC-2 type transport system permease protein
MLRTLLKKQLFEVFKGYFYDAKKNKMRSPLAIGAWIVFFFVIMVGLLGGMFLALSFTLCGPLISAGMDWMYFLMMGGMAILLGCFGSVYNTYTALYLAKDNDLLLSMPIPVRKIVGARLLNVYLMGTMYLVTVMIPMDIVYLMDTGVSVMKLICMLLLFFILSFFVLALSSLLGLFVAKISLKIKNKSFVTVAVTLLFIVGYYFFYFKAGTFIRDLLLHAQEYGEKIKGVAYVLYLFGLIGTGDIVCAIGFTVVISAAVIFIWMRMLKSFMAIATATGKVKTQRYVEKKVKEKSLFGAMLSKELTRFTSSPNYMLNCGLGILLIPAAGVYFLLEAKEFMPLINEAMADRPQCATILVCMALCLLASMNLMAAPSVSLEGKNLWISRSLPIKPWVSLAAKAGLQIILTGIPMLLGSIMTAIGADAPLGEKVLLVLMPMVFVLFSAILDTMIAVKMPILSWTNEIEPIKHSGGVFLAMFGSWVICVIFTACYMFFGYLAGNMVYMLIWTVAFAVLSIAVAFWLKTKGAKEFAAL